VVNEYIIAESFVDKLLVVREATEISWRRRERNGTCSLPPDGLRRSTRLTGSDAQDGRRWLEAPSSNGAKLAPREQSYDRSTFAHIQENVIDADKMPGRYVGLRDSRVEAFSYNKRTIDRAMGPF